VNGKPIRPSIPNVGQWLREKAGYETVYAGKWHLPASYSASIPGFRVRHIEMVDGDAGRMVRTLRYKYITYRGNPTDQLFDMRNDHGETKNLARRPEYASVVAEHREILRRWESRLDVAPNVPRRKARWRNPERA